MKYQISKFLDKFLEQQKINITDFANEMEVSHAYVSYIKHGNKTASKKFIANLIKKYPVLKSREKEILGMLEKDKKIEKLKNYEKKRQEIIGENVELNAKEINQFEKILNSASYFFNDEGVSEEDKNKMKDSLLEAFYDAKAKNRRK